MSHLTPLSTAAEANSTNIIYYNSSMLELPPSPCIISSKPIFQRNLKLENSSSTLQRNPNYISLNQTFSITNKEANLPFSPMLFFYIMSIVFSFAFIQMGLVICCYMRMRTRKKGSNSQEYSIWSSNPTPEIIAQRKDQVLDARYLEGDEHLQLNPEAFSQLQIRDLSEKQGVEV